MCVVCVLDVWMKEGNPIDVSKQWVDTERSLMNELLLNPIGLDPMFLLQPPVNASQHYKLDTDVYPQGVQGLPAVPTLGSKCPH